MARIAASLGSGGPDPLQRVQQPVALFDEDQALVLRPVALGDPEAT